VESCVTRAGVATGAYHQQRATFEKETVYVRNDDAPLIFSKTGPTRWGLYLADAKSHAEAIALLRQAEEKRRIDAEIAREHQRAPGR
jgi:hypothetical protein